MASDFRLDGSVEAPDGEESLQARVHRLGAPGETADLSDSGMPINSVRSDGVRSASVRRKHVDRPRWRRQIRSRPRLRSVYRIAVAMVGVGLMVLALAIGWLPGPGGVPLFLLGLAVLATEFVWARRLLHQANREAHRAARWSARQPRWVHRLMGLGLACGISFGIWLVLFLFGVPAWLPGAVAQLPGLQR